MKYLITLVHGTFAKKAPWTTATSNFRNAIIEKLSGEVRFETFDWSGKNSHKARLSSAESLADQLSDQLKIYPEHQKIIIAHSHGGNIALYALNKMGEESAGFKLVTMATPFLNASLRDYAGSLQNRNTMKFAFYGIISALAIVFKIPGFVNPIYLGLSWVTLFIAAVITFIFFNKWTRKANARKSASLESSINRLRLPQGNDFIPILAIIDQSDEIRIWFGSLYRIWELLLGSGRLSEKLMSWAWKIYFINIFGFIIGYSIGIGGKLFGDVVIWTFFITFLAILILPAITIIMPLVFTLFKSNPFVLGWETTLEQNYIRVIPSITPLGLGNISILQYAIKPKKLFGLKHSIYEHEQVTADITHWICKSGIIG